MVLSVNGELTENLPSIQEEKGVYYAAAVIGELETAKKIPRGCPPQYEDSGRAPQSTQPAGRTVQRPGPGLFPAMVLQNPLRLCAGDFSFR